MEGSGPIRVLILYVHPLLGEGLAKLLAAEPGIAARAIAMADAPGTAAALSARPDAVIVERRDASAPLALQGAALPGGSAPLLLFVDIEGTATPSAPDADRIHASMTRPVIDDLERVVRAVRDLRGRRLALVGA